MMTSEIKIVLPGTDLRGYTWWGPSASFTALLTPNSQYQDTMGNGGCGAPRDRPVQHRNYQPERWRVGGVPRARGYHPGGVNVGFCDGSVRFIKNSVSFQSYQALSTTAGGEVLSSDSY